ncbi:PREDICTED: LOB domain-containing protein 6-like [Tarenaya hassleriana]|uniref:LOB domain-containing protein 6-like n=1 Tax=Tarenaya hassleriana TaxID=28532 RepID=UPI00053C5913|nr:PREDICTED: LOB domain-containing protein 6-like [Tarenaya hassleriana]XP_010551661.1 PREDICTED: LOB domain-containing protein 6-like [Tarenaya hassleriana]
MASSSSSNSPCAACKFLRRKCQPECVFAPYFPPDQPQKFANVHKVFGASNVTKLLNELHPSQREDAVNSLAYEADMRLRDPVYGCVGVISLLQHQLRQLQIDLSCAKSELSKYQSLGLLGINLLGGNANASTNANANAGHQFHHQFFPREQMFGGFVDNHHHHHSGGSNYDGATAGILTIGQIATQFQQPCPAAGDDVRRTIDPS